MQTAQNTKDASKRAENTSFPSLKQGEKLAGCYVLRGESHIGSVASVWHAHDEVLGKDVALHFIPQSIRGDEKAMDELRQLTKRNRQLIHPNILRIYDFIEENDWAAVTTDVVDGESLAELRRKRNGEHFEVADVKPWLAQLCQTVDDAHKIQLFHGDLSPEHVFVGEAGRVVAANFGIGRCVRDAMWRVAGSNGGTPPVENLSPQLLDGQAPCPADDVYAMGVLLHELLVGQPPFTDPDLSGKIRNTAAGKVLERRAELNRAGGPVPPIWEKVIAACLEKTAVQRPKSLADLSARLALPKSSGKSEEPVEPTTLVEPAAEAPMTEGEPVIPVVKKAWVGSTPIFGGATIAKAESDSGRIDPTEVDMADAGGEVGTKPGLRNSLSDGYPRAGSRKSGFPVTGAAAAVLLAGLTGYAVYVGGFRTGKESDPAPGVHTVSAGEPQYEPVKNPISNDLVEPLPTTDLGKPPTVVEAPPEQPVVAVATTVPAEVVAVSTPAIDVATNVKIAESTPAAPAIVADSFPPKPEIDSALIVAANPKPPKNAAPPAATPSPAVAAGASASVAAKTAALEATRKSVEEWDKAHATMLKKKEQAETAIAEAKKTLDEKMKAAAPMLKASEEVAALKQQREEEMRAADLAAAEAKKAAEEKARLAEEARKAALSVEKDNRDKLAGQKKAEAELEEIKKTIAENERLAAESAKLAEGAMAKKGEQSLLVQQKEQEVALAMAAAEIEAQKKRDLEERKNRIMKEMDDARRAFEERMKSLEAAIKDPEGAAVPPKPPVEKAPPSVKPAAPPTPPPAAVVPAAPTPPVAEVRVPADPAPPSVPPADTTLLAKMEKPASVPAVEPKGTPASPGAPFTNSIGIPFVPVGDVQFAVWPTRLKDFDAFATATGLKSSLWRDPGFKQGPDHPVVNVTWMEAMAFCKWLTFKEQREGTLPAGKVYRLPTDMEWSKAVGLPDESGKTAEARDMGVPDVYPWGTTWPPPQGAGNYTGEETGSDVAIKGYSDGFPWTSPVGSFPPNKNGISDMGGNVWQWVMDPWNTDSTSKVLRGASWYNGALKLSLLSSCRVHAAQDSSTDNYGFRCVIASETPKSAKR